VAGRNHARHRSLLLIRPHRKKNFVAVNVLALGQRGLIGHCSAKFPVCVVFANRPSAKPRKLESLRNPSRIILIFPGVSSRKRPEHQDIYRKKNFRCGSSFHPQFPSS
jgi:hypothetical protein